MNYLKIKLGLFSLLAVLAVSVFLTSCEQETIETTPSDVLLESLEETTNTSNTTGIDEFQDMLFSQTRVPVFADDGSNMFIELNGELLVASDGAITGSVTAVSDDEAVDGTVTFRNEIIIYETENGRVEFNIFSDLENLTVFENDVTKKATLSNSIDKLIEDKDKRLTELSIEVQAVRAYLAIFNSEAFIANARYAQSSDNMNLRHDCSAWQTFIVISLASVVAAPVGFTCLAALPPCIGGSMAFPPAAVPCIVGEVACAAAATAGFAGAREILEAWICSGELPPAPEPCHGPDWIQGNTTGGGTVNLWWDDSTGILPQREYVVVQQDKAFVIIHILMCQLTLLVEILAMK